MPACWPRAAGKFRFFGDTKRSRIHCYTVRTYDDHPHALFFPTLFEVFFLLFSTNHYCYFESGVGEYLGDHTAKEDALYEMTELMRCLD